MTGQLSIAWSPLLPSTVMIALGVATLLVLLLVLWRRAPGAWWRVLGAGVLLLALANPSLIEEERDPLDDIALIVVDESPSQRVEPRPEQNQAALAHLTETLEGISDLDTRVVRVAGGGLGEDQQGTRLFSALRQALSTVPRQRVGGVIVVSDGQIHDVPDNLDALGFDAPIHLLLTGREEERDRRIVITHAPRFGIVGRELTLKFQVDALPDRDSREPVVVTLRQDGGPPRILQVPTGVEQEVTFGLKRRGGSIIELEAEAGPEELTLINNRTAVEVNGVRDRLRVLLVSGEPHGGERAWRNILKSDPSVDLVHFTILRPPEKQDGTPIRELSLIAFPTRELFEVKLDEFDLIIFDRYRRRGVLPTIYLDNIARYVEKGGALLEAVGPTFATPLSLYRTPLGRILPAEPSGNIFEEGFRPALTELGRRHPVTAALPGSDDGPNGGPSWGRWFRQIDVYPAAGATVMNGIGGRPLLILERVGEGRVAQIMSDHMWLWSRGFEGGGPQAELLRRVAHWLMKEPDLEEEDLRATVNGNRLEVQRRSLDLDLPPIRVTLPSGAVEQLTLQAGPDGKSVAVMEVTESGLYRASDGERTALAAVGPLNPAEFEDLRATAERLEPLVDESGGAVVKLAAQGLPDLRRVKPGRDRHGRDWIGLQANGGYVVTGVAQAPLLPAILVLLLTIGGIMMAWWREGR